MRTSQSWGGRSQVLQIRHMKVKSQTCSIIPVKMFILRLDLSHFVGFHSFPGGRYQLEIKIPETYPFNPPKVCIVATTLPTLQQNSEVLMSCSPVYHVIPLDFKVLLVVLILIEIRFYLPHKKAHYKTRDISVKTVNNKECHLLFPEQ